MRVAPVRRLQLPGVDCAAREVSPASAGCSSLVGILPAECRALRCFSGVDFNLKSMFTPLQPHVLFSSEITH